MSVAKDSTAKVTNQEQPGGKQPFFDASGAIDGYRETVNWFQPYFEPIDELERIARNKPSDKIDPSLPRVTDGTMAAIVQEQPKRIIQQTATGLVECMDYPELAEIADIVNREILIPSQNRMGTSLQKDWNMLSKAMTWGRSTSYTFFTQTDGRFHTDFVIPYVKDVYSEKGKVYAPDSNISYMRSWYQKRDLKSILNRETALEKKDKSYKSDWNLLELGNFIDSGSSAKPANLQTPAEREKGGDYGGYEVIHAFQRGIGAEFYSFAPRKGDKKQLSLRTKINSDPRGKLPLDHEYCNIDLSNPLGRGQVELSGGVQNLIDQQMQMFQFLTTLLMAPPLKVRGNVNKASLKFRPNAIWDMGTNQSNDVDPYQVSNYAVQSFPGNYGLLKSQIMNLNSSQDHSVSAQDAPGQSKTQAGVQASEAKLGVSDNYLRKQHETWKQDQMETGLNIYFSEMKTKETIRLKEDDLKELRDKVPSKWLTKEGVLTIPYKEINDVILHFTVNPSSSEIKEDADNVEKLTQVYQIMSSDQDPAIQQKKTKVLKVLIDEIGAEGTDDLFDDKQVDENGQPIAPEQAPGADPNAIMQQLMPQVQQMVAEMLKQQKQAPKSLGESVAWKPGDLTPAERAQALQQVGIQADQTALTPNDEQAAHTQGLEIAKTAHDQALSLHSAAQPQPAPGQDPNQASQGQPTDPNNGQAPDQGQQDTLSPDEEQLAHALIQRGFNDGDIEQAVQMSRSGHPLGSIIPTIAAKYAGAPA